MTRGQAPDSHGDDDLSPGVPLFEVADSLGGRAQPDYVMGCKRVLFSNDWYPTLARPDVELVTDPIERIVQDGVVTADGTTRRADVIIYGTGFRTLDFLAPMSVTGRGGRRPWPRPVPSAPVPARHDIPPRPPRQPAPRERPSGAAAAPPAPHPIG